MQASKKIFTRISKLSKCQECSYVFQTTETTEGKTNGKKFIYIGTKYKLNKPIEVSKGESFFHVNYKSDVKSYRNTLPNITKNEVEKINESKIEYSSEMLEKINKEPEYKKITKKIVPPY